MELSWKVVKVGIAQGSERMKLESSQVRMKVHSGT